MQFSFKYFLLLVLVVFISSCSEDDETGNDFIYPDNLSNELKLLLETNANGTGLAFYTMPEDGDLSGIPQDPNNHLTKPKVELGKLLYHESAFANNPMLEAGKHTFSCSSCHHAGAGFQAGRQQGIGEGGSGFGINGEARNMQSQYTVETCDVQPLRSPSTLNVAYQKNMLWNGQFGATGVNTGTENLWQQSEAIATNELGYEGVETQAIAGYGVHRMHISPQEVAMYQEYINRFAQVFPNQADIFNKENAGLAIAAYERTLLSNKAPFQKWLKGDAQSMTDKQKKGAILFFGKANCVSCHNGPALNSMEFYALGMNDLTGEGVFNVNPTNPAHLGRGSFTQNPQDNYKFKVPQLYNLTDSPFYGHGSSFNTVKQVIEYKNNAIAQNPNVPNEQLADDFIPLNLTESEINQLVDFIENALYDANLERFVPTQLPSDLCFPNNDAQSIIDLGCQ